MSHHNNYHKQSSSRFIPNPFCKRTENIKVLKDIVCMINDGFK